MPKRIDDAFSVITLNTKDIRYKDINNDNAFVENTAHTLNNLDKIVKGLESSVRSSTGETGFNINRNRITVDPVTQVGTIQLIVKKEFEQIIKDSIKDFDAKSNLTGDLDLGFSSSMQVERGIMLEYNKSNIYGRRARNMMAIEAEKAGGYAKELSPTRKSPERMQAVLIVPESELASRTESSLFNSAFSRTLSLSKAEKKARNIAEKEKQEEIERKEAEKLAIQEQKKREAHKKQLDAIEKSQHTPSDILDIDVNKKMAQAEEDERKAKNQQEVEKLREENAGRRRLLRTLGMIVSALVVIGDVVRRILTASLERVSDEKRNTVEAHSINVSAMQRRGYDIFDMAHGMDKGTTFGAMQSLQGLFGDVTKLDENALGVLARVMGSEVADMVHSGMGGKAPDKLLDNILNKYFSQFKAGKNSLGQSVGIEQARRELITSLQSVSPEIARVFAQMAEDWSSGLYGDFGNTEEWRNTTVVNRTRLLTAERKYAEEVGKKYDEILAIVEDLKSSFFDRLANTMDGLITKIRNLRLGEDGKQRIEDDERNMKKLEQNKETMKNFIEQTNTADLSSIRQGRDIPFTPFDLYAIYSGIYSDSDIKSKFKGYSIKEVKEKAKRQYRNAMADKGLRTVLTRIEVAQNQIKAIEEEQSKGIGGDIADISISENALSAKAEKLSKKYIYALPKARRELTAGEISIFANAVEKSISYAEPNEFIKIEQRLKGEQKENYIKKLNELTKKYGLDEPSLNQRKRAYAEVKAEEWSKFAFTNPKALTFFDAVNVVETEDRSMADFASAFAFYPELINRLDNALSYSATAYSTGINGQIVVQVQGVDEKGNIKDTRTHTFMDKEMATGHTYYLDSTGRITGERESSMVDSAHENNSTY